MWPDDNYLEALSNRTVTYNYRGRSLRFALSHGLFSSAGVDAGTHGLLATIAGQLKNTRYDEVIDLGCGTGTLGISRAVAGDAPLQAYDRDMLAVEFTRANARANHVDHCTARAALGIPDTTGGTRRLVVSNIPAKAGAPVIDHMIDSIVYAAGSNGSGAIVIVRPLEALVMERLALLDVPLLASRATANHRVVVFGGRESPDPAAPPATPASAAASPSEPATGWKLPRHFVRGRSRFVGPVSEYELDTVFNLPEFDQLGYRTALLFDLLRSLSLGGRVAVYGNGQGHVAEGCRQRGGPSMNLHVYDRDLLSLCTVRHNGPVADTHLVVTLASVCDGIAPGTVDWLVVNDDPVPGSIWNEEVLFASRHLLAPAGKLLIVSRSNSIARLLKQFGKQLRHQESRRMYGYRAELVSLKR